MYWPVIQVFLLFSVTPFCESTQNYPQVFAMLMRKLDQRRAVLQYKAENYGVWLGGNREYSLIRRR